MMKIVLLWSIALTALDPALFFDGQVTLEVFAHSERVRLDSFGVHLVIPYLARINVFIGVPPDRLRFCFSRLVVEGTVASGCSGLIICSGLLVI